LLAQASPRRDRRERKRQHAVEPGDQTAFAVDGCGDGTRAFRQAELGETKIGGWHGSFPNVLVLEHIIGRAGTDSNCLVGVSVVGVSVPRAILAAAVGGPSDCLVLAFRFESLASTTELFFHSTRPVANVRPAQPSAAVPGRDPRARRRRLLRP